MGAGGIATMWEAVLQMLGVALLAVMNASRVLKIKSFKNFNFYSYPQIHSLGCGFFVN